MLQKTARNGMIQIIPDILLPLFVLLVLAVIAAAIITVVNLARGAAFLPALRPLALMLLFYVSLMVIGSATSRERRVPLGTILCFGDWCATVDNIKNAAAVPSQRSRVVTAGVRVTSIAKRVTQHGSGPTVYLIDTHANW